MAKIREYMAGDLEAVRRMHTRQGFSYELPDFEDLIFLEKLVMEDAGEPVMGAFLRLTAEAYFLHEPEAGTAKERWARFLTLHEVMRARAIARGIEDVYCWVPPEVTPKRPLPEKPKPRGFEKRLEGLGWQTCRWRCFTRSLKD